MPKKFKFGEIKTIAKRLGLSNARGKVWNGVDCNGQFWQTFIHDHADGRDVPDATASKQAQQMGFKNLEDMHDFLKNTKRKR